jgi:uncharacterized membrane protein YcaP (DUF421 family)
MEHLFFNSWDALLRIVIVGIVSYAALVLLLRAAGKRTLSRMSAYDMVITMALGSILAKVLLTPDQSISESVTAMFMLIGLQYSVSVAMCHCRWLRHFISSKPAVLFHQGEFMDNAMRKERVDKDEVQAAIHAKGIADNSMVEAVILGTNGDLSVLLKPGAVCAVSVAAGAKPSGEL